MAEESSEVPRMLSAPVPDSRRVEIYTGFYPTQLVAEREAALIESQNPAAGFEYLIERQPGGLYYLQVFRESAAPGPTLLYNLELDAEELSALHQLLQWSRDDRNLGASTPTPAEEAIAEKVLRLMEGR